MHRNCFLYILLLLTGRAFSQLPVLQWAKAVKADPVWSNLSNYSNGRTIGTDAQGNVYSAGLFDNTMDFDPGPGVYDITSGTGYSSVYILKLDAAGNFVWAKQIPTIVEFGDIELKIGADGAVYLASNLPHPADMDPGPGVQMMTPIGAKDAFVIKLDTNGNLVWAKQFGGPGDTVPEANCLDLDKDGNVIICGMFNRTVDFDPGPGTFNLTSTAHMQAYIVKLSSSGDFIWAEQFGNAPVVYSGSHVYDIRCDPQGNIFTVGGFKGLCDFDPGSGVYSLNATTYGDGFVCKLDQNGNFVWAKALTGTNYSDLMVSRAIDIDGAGNVLTTGSFLGTYDLDPGPGVYSVSANPYDCYILKLDGQGNFLWAKSIGGTGSDTGNDLSVDNSNNVYVVGSFAPSVDFDPGPATYYINRPNDYAEVVLKFNPAGNFVYVAPFQTAGNNYGTGLFRRMCVDNAQNIYVTGMLSGTLDFDPGPNVYPLSGTYDESPFVLKLSRCTNVTTSALNVSTCNSYTLNNETFDSSGTYIRILPNASGCDSIITLHLTVNKKFTQQTKTLCEGDFFFTGGANQTTPGLYVDTLQTTQGCDSIVTTTLVVNPKPKPSLGPDKDLCAGSSLTLVPGQFAGYQWQDQSTSPTMIANSSGLYFVSVTDANNCSANDSVMITSIPLPANFLKHTDSICSYDKLLLQPVDSFSTYLWSTGATQSQISITAPGQYWLRVSNREGCYGADTIIVMPKDCMKGFYAPSAFSPNGDGKNDAFYPLLFGNMKTYRFTVYNRWGQVVFQTTELQKGWDGKVAGTLQRSDVFVWTCTYQLEGEAQKTEKGTVTLIR